MKSAIVFGLLFISFPAFAQHNELVVKACDFLLALEPEKREQVQYPFDAEERFNWSFVPKRRKGLTFHHMNENQRKAALSLLKASLSVQGYQKATGVIALEAILRIEEGRDMNDSYRDPMNYSFILFGSPGGKEPWGWRIEGHHLSFTFSSLLGEIISSTPSFLGSNPATVSSGMETGKQVLKLESDLGFMLVNSLNPAQAKIAIFSKAAPPEILSYTRRKVTPLEPEGIPYAALNEQQQKIFLQLLNVYVRNYQLGFSKKLMTKIENAGLGNLTFAWAGSLQPGSGHYYRIQGPTVLIEYDNTQNRANHIHTVVRDLTNDFGEDILREHYEREH